MDLNDQISELLDDLREPHDWFEGFDDSVCYGGHPAVDGVCPKLVEGRLDRCGVCGCFIRGLQKSQSAPTNCTRIEAHKQD